MVSHYHCQSSFLNSVVHSLPKCLLATIWMWIIPLLLWILYKILWAFSMPIQMKIPQHQSFLLHWLVRITTNGLKRCSKRWLQRTRRNLLMEASENLIGVIRLTKHGKDATTVWYVPGLWSLMLGGTCEKDSDTESGSETKYVWCSLYLDLHNPTNTSVSCTNSAPNTLCRSLSLAWIRVWPTL